MVRAIFGLLIRVDINIRNLTPSDIFVRKNGQDLATFLALYSGEKPSAEPRQLLGAAGRVRIRCQRLAALGGQLAGGLYLAEAMRDS